VAIELGDAVRQHKPVLGTAQGIDTGAATAIAPATKKTTER